MPDVHKPSVSLRSQPSLEGGGELRSREVGSSLSFPPPLSAFYCTSTTLKILQLLSTVNQNSISGAWLVGKTLMLVGIKATSFDAE